MVGFIPIGCLCIKDEGHQSRDHKQEHVSEISILATLFREVFKGVHCRVLGVVVNAVSLQYYPPATSLNVGWCGYSCVEG
jgi:hypothetical protein